MSLFTFLIKISVRTNIFMCAELCAYLAVHLDMV